MVYDHDYRSNWMDYLIYFTKYHPLNADCIVRCCTQKSTANGDCWKTSATLSEHTNTGM